MDAEDMTVSSSRWFLFIVLRLRIEQWSRQVLGYQRHVFNIITHIKQKSDRVALHLK